MAVEPFQQHVGEIPEASTVLLGGTLEAPDGTALAGSGLTTCTLTVYDPRTGDVVAGFDGLDIKASVDGSGVLARSVPIAATVVGVAGRRVERVFLVRWTYNGGADGGWFRWIATVVLDPQVA
jgi:hypothetical protein